MPIDFKGRIAQDEQALADLLERRRTGISSGIDQTRSEIGAGRAQAFGPELESRLQGAASQFGLSPSAVSAGMAQGAQVQGGLENSLEGILGNQKYGMQRERTNLAYNRALDRAQAAGLQRREAEKFARQIMQDEIRRQNEGAMGEKQRQQLIRRQGIENTFSRRGEDMKLSQMSDGTDEYQSAVMRILTGMPSQLLTYYGLSGGFGGGFGKEKVNPTQGQTNYQPQYPKLDERPFGGYS